MANDILKENFRQFRIEHDARIAESIAAASSSALDTVPSTINGGMWYELDNSAPVIKFYQGGNTYSVTPTLDVIELQDPNLTVTPSTATMSSSSATATVSYAGSGTVSLHCYETGVTSSYNSSTKVITVPYQGVAHDTRIAVTNISLSAAENYSAATATFTVYMQPAGTGTAE